MSTHSWMTYPVEKHHIGQFVDGTFVSSFGTSDRSTPVERMDNAFDEHDEIDNFKEIVDKLEDKIVGMDFLGRNADFCSRSNLSDENKKFVEELIPLYSYKEIMDILEEVKELESNECDYDPRLRAHYFVNY